MTYHFRNAIATEAKPLVGLYAESGRGKTYGALLLAKGFAGDMSRVGMIETEAGRGEAHADDPILGGYKVLPLREDFSPRVFGAAIAAAEQAKLQVLIVDSASHEWEGVGGVLDLIDRNKRAGKKGVAASTQPKMDHNREFILRLTQTPIPFVITCMRAKYAMYEVTEKHIEKWEQAGKPGGERMRPELGKWARSWTLEPKQSDDILSEMFVHGWIDEQHKFHLTKETMPAMRTIFLDNEAITIETGKRLAAWASGRQSQPSQPSAQASVPQQPGTAIDADQVKKINEALKATGIPVAALLAALEKAGIKDVLTVEQIPADAFPRAMAWINKAADRAA